MAVLLLPQQIGTVKLFTIFHTFNTKLYSLFHKIAVLTDSIFLTDCNLSN